LPWVIEGAAVAVSIVCFAPDADRCATSATLDGRVVRAIRSDLRDIDLPLTSEIYAASRRTGILPFKALSSPAVGLTTTRRCMKTNKVSSSIAPPRSAFCDQGVIPIAAPTAMSFGHIGAVMKRSAARGTASSSTSAQRLQSLRPRDMRLPTLISNELSEIGDWQTGRGGPPFAGGYINGHGPA